MQVDIILGSAHITKCGCTSQLMSFKRTSASQALLIFSMQIESRYTLVVVWDVQTKVFAIRVGADEKFIISFSCSTLTVSEFSKHFLNLKVISCIHQKSVWGTIFKFFVLHSNFEHWSNTEAKPFFVCKSIKYAGDRILKITFLKAMKHDLINEKLKPFMLKLCPIFVSSFNDLAKRSKTIFFRFSFIAELWCLDRDRLLSWIDFSVFKKDIFTIQVSWFQNSWSILINSNF